MDVKKALQIHIRNRPHDVKLARPIIAYFGRRALWNVTSRRIGLYKMHRLRAGAAATTINKELQLMKRVLHADGYDPAIRPLPDIPREPKPLDLNRLEAVAANNQRWRQSWAVAIVCAATGLSRQGLRRLTWEDVDPWGETLAGVPFTPRIIDLLLRLERERTSAPGRCRRSDRLLDFRSWKDAWRVMMREAGFEGVTLRDVRLNVGLRGLEVAKPPAEMANNRERPDHEDHAMDRML